jgi:thymidylate synthase ThyX
MNERVRELQKESGLHAYYDAQEDHIRKFADLLLEDVMQELFINGYEDAFDHLNKHFGVEE